jgi:hypothetical protein
MALFGLYKFTIEKEELFLRVFQLPEPPSKMVEKAAG